MEDINKGPTESDKEHHLANTTIRIGRIGLKIRGKGKKAKKARKIPVKDYEKGDLLEQEGTRR